MEITWDRLLVFAIAVTLLAADGVRRLLKQAKDEEISPRPFRVMMSALIAGVLLTWIGVVLMWMRETG
jgi:hypothetical protein